MRNIHRRRDLIVHKCFAGRGQDLADAETVIVRHLKKLDLEYIRYWLSQLERAIENPEIPARFEILLRKAGSLLSRGPLQSSWASARNWHQD